MLAVRLTDHVRPVREAATRAVGSTWRHVSVPTPANVSVVGEVLGEASQGRLVPSVTLANCVLPIVRELAHGKAPRDYGRVTSG